MVHPQPQASYQTRNQNCPALMCLLVWTQAVVGQASALSPSKSEAEEDVDSV